jgi:hypothetical protein
MGGNTGNIRTSKISSSNGYKTLGSIIADGNNGGAGSTKRVYEYYARIYRNNPTIFYENVLGLTYGSQRGQYWLSNY